jgi:cytoplasmic iron level regulating protein YaaA (DUF328/UPF0246 family)
LANKWEPCFQNNTEGDSAMQTIDYRQQLLEEIESLSDRELEKIYKIVTLLRHEFLEEDDESRYYTDSWIQAEREAIEAYQRGGLKAYDSVDEMMDDILSEPDDE